MSTTIASPSIEPFEFTRTDLIEAPIEIVFQAMLDELGPEQQLPSSQGGQPMPMKLEAWPGGRWFRDLGNNSGHLWGHVQVIKPPTLLELCGPFFMSYPAVNHAQYRLTAEGKNTRLQFTHRAIGPIPQEQRDGMSQGWGNKLNRLAELAARRIRR